MNSCLVFFFFDPSVFTSILPAMELHRQTSHIFICPLHIQLPVVRHFLFDVAPLWHCLSMSISVFAGFLYQTHLMPSISGIPQTRFQSQGYIFADYSMGIAFSSAAEDQISTNSVLWRFKVSHIYRKRNMKYFGHVTRHNSLEKDVMIGPMFGLRR